MAFEIQENWVSHNRPKLAKIDLWGLIVRFVFR